MRRPTAIKTERLPPVEKGAFALVHLASVHITRSGRVCTNGERPYIPTVEPARTTGTARSSKATWSIAPGPNSFSEKSL
jgi:hypothetical protein